AGLAAGFIATSGLPDELQRRAEDLLLTDRPAVAERLRGPESNLRDRLAEFTEVRTAPGFESLPGRIRGLIRDRQEELSEYLAWYDQLRQLPSAADEAHVERIEQLRAALVGPLALPRPEWDETDAGRLYHERLDESDAL